MKNPKGGFHCGSGLKYYIGSCTNGTGLLVGLGLELALCAVLMGQ